MKRQSSIVNRQSSMVALLLLTFAVLFPPYYWSFVGDDFVQFRYVWRFMDRPFTALSLLDPYALPWYYRPLQNWWFLANRLVFDFNPFPYYAILAGLHSLAISLVYRTSRQLRLPPLAAVGAAILFAVHGHWVDVVGWLSSVAIVLAAVLNLAAVSAYLRYLKVRQGRWLGLTAVFFLLALITHEESFLLPMMLLLLRGLGLGDRKANASQLTGSEIALFIGMFLLTAVYLYSQFTRPNLTLEANQIGLSGYLAQVQLGQIGRFMSDSLLHFTLWAKLINLTSGVAIILNLISASLILFGYLYGNRLIRLGLTWLLLHLTFIYFALWTQKPELFAGRHIYQAWIGLVWVAGAGIAWLGVQARKRERQKVARKRQPIGRLYLPLVLVFFTAVFIYHLQLIRVGQASWLQLAQRYHKAEVEVKALLPAIDENTAVFAHRFPITPPFLPATFQVWYEATLNTAVGGSLAQLQEIGEATSDYYLFDYQDGTVVNLMPELQQHGITRFLWAANGRLEQITADGTAINLPEAELKPVVIGPEDDLRVAIAPPAPETAVTWNSLVYLYTIPTNSQLQLSLLAPEGDAAFRVRLLGLGAEWDVLLETAVTTPNQWTDISIPLHTYAEQTVIIRLESTKDGTWGNPRITSD